MIVWKDIFRPGKYLLPDGREVEFTAQHIHTALKNGRRMLANRQAVPAIFEHDWSAAPVPLSAVSGRPNWPETFAKKTLGHVLQYEIRTDEGLPVLWAKHDVPNESDAKRWRACRFASVRLDWDADDSKGNRYPGVSVQHVAVTPRPIQVEQLPVKLSTKDYGRTVYLSMGSRKMAEENSEKTGGTEDKGGAGSSDSAVFGRVTAALAAMGKSLPDSVTDWNGLATALEVMAANDGGSGGDPLEEDEDDLGGTNTANPPVMMSAQQRAAEARLVAVERNQLHQRATRATAALVKRGLLSAESANKFTRNFTTVSLSFTPAGEVKKNDLIVQLETYEQLAANFRKAGGQAGVNLSQTTTVPAPAIGKRDPAAVAERAKSAAELMMSVSGFAPKK